MKGLDRIDFLVKDTKAKLEHLGTLLTSLAITTMDADSLPGWEAAQVAANSISLTIDLPPYRCDGCKAVAVSATDNLQAAAPFDYVDGKTECRHNHQGGHLCIKCFAGYIENAPLDLEFRDKRDYLQDRAKSEMMIAAHVPPDFNDKCEHCNAPGTANDRVFQYQTGRLLYLCPVCWTRCYVATHIDL